MFDVPYGMSRNLANDYQSSKDKGYRLQSRTPVQHHWWAVIHHFCHAILPYSNTAKALPAAASISKKQSHLPSGRRTDASRGLLLLDHATTATLTMDRVKFKADIYLIIYSPFLIMLKAPYLEINNTIIQNIEQSKPFTKCELFVVSL